MTAARLVQNFRGVRALLALVDAGAADADEVDAGEICHV